MDVSGCEELRRENEALRDRLSRLSEASCRINESLDTHKVLQGVLDSARLLTGGRYGVFTLLDDSGRIQDFLSSGLTAEEARRIWDTPDGLQIFEYLSGLSEPLRIPDLLGVLRSLGLPEVKPPAAVGGVLSFLAAPVLHREERVGNLFVADKEAAREFTAVDEETLIMFASQAALVITNSRRYRDEQRARNDLETLINISPVGVVVLDAGSGAPLSLNREAGRIFNGLRSPDQAPDELLEVLTVERADGRRVSLDKASVVEALSTAGTVRAEQVVMRVPDGRSVTVQVNATPMRSEDGAVESLIVTLQDLTPLEEMERLRAQFLAMVSQELRMPLASIKGSAATVLGSPVSLERAEFLQFFRIVDLEADRMHLLIGDLLDLARIDTGTLAVNPESVAIGSLVEEARQAFLSEGGRKNLVIELPSGLPLVMADPSRIVQVLGTLLSNAARHSSEDSPIRVTAVSEDVHVAVSVSDEGRGVSADLSPFTLKRPSGVDGGNQGSGAAGSGLDLAVCKGIVETHGGRMRAESHGPGLGARFTFTLPAVDAGGVAGAVDPASRPFRLRPGSSETVRILVVDEDPQALGYVREALARAGYLPIVTADPEEIPRLVKEEKPDLVLVDLMQPGSGGIELINVVLALAQAPVIFLSAYGSEEASARALDLGAADYLVKPFSPTELAARIKAALRGRAGLGWAAPSDPYAMGDLRISYADRRVTVAGRPVQLTATEYELLHRLSTAEGRVLTHDQLLQWVWNPQKKGEPWLVRNVVKKLRHKLGDDANNPTYIFTEPRVGYRMAKSRPQREPGS